MTADAQATQERARRALAVPLLKYLGAAPADAHDATRGIRLSVTPGTLNAAGSLHGGAIATVLDVAAFLAVLPVLEDDEDATTHAFSASYLEGAVSGDEVVATARVLRRGRWIAFVAAELRGGPTLLATATVTKSIRAR